MSELALVWNSYLLDSKFFSFFYNFFFYHCVLNSQHLKKIFIFYFRLRWVFISVHGLFSSCGEKGLLFVTVGGLLIVVASLVAEHGL